MAAPGTARMENRKRQQRADSEVLLDRDLEDLPPDLRWREWMMRVEAVIFASREPVSREVLARVVGKDCSIDLLVDDLREELRNRPYDIVSVASGWQHRTRLVYGQAIRASAAPTRHISASLSDHEAAVLMTVGYFQPVTRTELTKIFGKEVSRDTMAGLREAGFLASGPRSPTPGAPYTFVTTPHFLASFGFDTLRDLPNMEMLEDAGLLSRHDMAQPDEVEDSTSDEMEE
ncbi:chromosome segregation and condensation protein ScpB [Pararhizobium capsulatum DSM 1112]|uniref:Chromosome segregation and condensation protein ScpB n=1 Tax=Pararhizobium capsulatum DSM 1112 TaxID=1121113 RepID=A0ABU0BWF2_9HYPH|nr:SMC-Scp complex subunit ScpB [Pararhizobium capsulatum]MDQ0322586.1 chromosome segregation and condensation protein ScpB [Pararhizobium capsulatum DSM 1112]